MTTKSKCCGASFSGIGDWTSSGTATVDYFCGACGKRCELDVPTDTKPEVTDAGWCAEQAKIGAQESLVRGV
jgi:hypothetical protein